MFYIYILKSKKDNSLYIGYTTNLERRFVEHNDGLSKSTKCKTPYQMIYYEGFANRIGAKHREEYLESGWGRRSIKKMLKKTLE